MNDRELLLKVLNFLLSRRMGAESLIVDLQERLAQSDRLQTQNDELVNLQDAPSFVTHDELANVVSQIADAIRHKMQADNLDGLVDRLRSVTTKEQA